jgi:ABC-2 type transport system permease protein
MKKYLTIIKAAWQYNLAWRFSIVAYRVGEITESLILILLWSAIYQSNGLIKGYTLQEMITYVLIGNLFEAMVRNYLTHKIARDIKDGTLSVFLVKPIKYINYIFTKEFGITALPFFMSCVSQLLVIVFFLDKIIFNHSIAYWALILLMLCLAYIIELFISYLVGMIAFWTIEVEGIYSTIIKLRKLFSGGYFPINLLPAGIVSVSMALPFMYSFYFPMQLYLKKISLTDGLKGVGLQVIWIIALYFISNVVWRRGLKKYEGVGI